MFMLLLSVTVAFGQAKWGGIARQVAMGGANAGTRVVVNPFIWEDPTFMLLNPAYQTMYKDYLWMNIGGGTLAGLTTANNGYGQQNAGLNFALNKEITVGAIFSYDPSSAGVISGLIAGNGGAAFGFPTFTIAQRATQVIPPIANVWEAIASIDGGTLDLGFGFMYGTSNIDSSNSANVGGAATSNTREASSRMFGFRGGGILDLGGGSALGFSAALRLDKANDKMARTGLTTPDGDYSASGTELQVEARLKLKMSNRLNFVPYGTFATVSGEPKEDTKPTAATTATSKSTKLTGTGIALGAGGEYKTSDFFLAGGISFTSIKIKIEANQAAVGATPASSTTAEFSYTAIPVFNLGGEWWFLDWLAGRAGYYRALGSVKGTSKSASGTNTISLESNRTVPLSFLVVGGLTPGSFDGIVTLGVGMRFGNFSLDATVSEEALRRGFGLIGAQDNINSFGFMTASYNFQ